MGIFSSFFNKNKSSRIKLMSKETQNYSDWSGSAYENDIVKSCVNARAKRFCKLNIQHIREKTENSKKTISINPEPYIKLMLQVPNPYMTMVDLLSKICKLADLTGNAFIALLRDDNGIVREMYPIPASSAEITYTGNGQMVYVFQLQNGSTWKFAYDDIVHLRDDYCQKEIFGDSKYTALKPLLNVIATTDKGIINAIKNSSVIRWLLKYTASMRSEDLKKNAKDFADNYLNISNNGSVGVAAVDAKADATQVNPQDYVPNATQMRNTRERVYSVFNINEKIIKSEANEDEENAYYEANIEPLALALQSELTRKLFTARERGCGNSIVIGSFNLRSASISTKLELQAMVDRGALTPNEWRDSLGLGPVADGDVAIRRLDTKPVEGGD